jgi:YD repeat-containing protein
MFVCDRDGITNTTTQLTQQTQTATQVQYDRAGNAIEMADAQIARFRAILREIDELQVEFDKVRRIGEIVKGFKSRVDRLDRRI